MFALHSYRVKVKSKESMASFMIKYYHHYPKKTSYVLKGGKKRLELPSQNLLNICIQSNGKGADWKIS